MECDTSGSVSASMHCLSLLTPSKRPKRNRDDDDSRPVLTSRICLAAEAAGVEGVADAARSYGLPTVTATDGEIDEDTYGGETVRVLAEFDGLVYESLLRRTEPQRLLGYPALLRLSRLGYPLPDLERPLYSTAMEHVVTCFTGFRDRAQVNWLVTCIHHMGGSIRKDFDYNRITHLIANKVGGEKYQYAVTFNVPVMSAEWVHHLWQRRHLPDYSATCPEAMGHTLKIFEGTRICWVGISDDEVQQMNEILASHGGQVTQLDDPDCTHVVIDPLTVSSAPQVAAAKALLVEVKWFWVSIQMDICASEKLYLFKEAVSTEATHSPRLSLGTANAAASPSTTPGSRMRKRKRLKDTVSQLAQGESPGNRLTVPGQGSLGDAHRRRSSIGEAALLSLSSSLLDVPSPEKGAGAESLLSASPLPSDLKSMTPRQQVFMELLHTEMNYVEILETVVEVFKKPLEDTDQVGGALLDPTEVKLIFGNVGPIYEIHSSLLLHLKKAAVAWREDASIGALFLNYSQELVKAYPPFVNFFEQTKEALASCDRTKPRFHAFLKLGQTNAKCRRQSLQELLIRPVQRLPSISLLLNDLLKQTPKSNPDHVELERALLTIKDVMTHINEDKRRTEGQVVLFDIFNDIDNCPAHLVSSHRTFISQCDVVELGDGIVGRGAQLTLFLFSDVIEICKRRSRSNTLKREASMISLQPTRLGGADKANKPNFKHVELISFSHVKRVVDIKESEDCHNVFALICRSHYETKERLYSFEIMSDDVEKSGFLRTLCRLMANITCRADSENYLACMEARQLDIDTTDLASGTLRRAARLASKTRMAVNRAFSFNKTPNRLKRAMSTVMSPLRSASMSASASSGVGVGEASTLSAPSPLAASCANLPATFKDF